VALSRFRHRACHGVLLAARSSLHSGKSVLYGKKTTALTKRMELIAWRLTRLGTYRLEADPSLSRRLLSHLSDNSRGRGSIGVGAARRLHERAAAVTPRFGGAAWRGIHGARRKLLIRTVAGRRASLGLRIRRNDRLTAFAAPRASLGPPRPAVEIDQNGLPRASA
jgi:hypothetical protein